MPTTRAQVDLYEKLQPEIVALHSEMSVLSKGKPDNPLNKFKLRHINERLKEANSLLVGPHKPLKGFEEFDEAAMPTNSDVVLILSQYLEALESWRSANTKVWSYSSYWDLDTKDLFPTQPATRFRRKRDDE